MSYIGRSKRNILQYMYLKKKTRNNWLIILSKLNIASFLAICGTTRVYISA